MKPRYIVAPAIFAWTGYCAPASISTQAQSVCEEIHSNTPSHLAFAPSSSKALSNSPELSALYESTTATYWDAANDADVPACVFFPSTAQEVSAAMIALGKQTGVPFALKSGGHNFNRGFSSTNGGVLISFRPNLQSTELSPDGQTATIGPGSRWLEAMTTLDKSDKCVVGGRIGDVGVGGLLAQGGLSYLSAQHGFACDSIIEYELVTANGTILTANNITNVDIFWALHGGGSAFGAITAYTVKTYDVEQVWGGKMTYDPSQLYSINAAITNFIAKNRDPLAAIIPGYMFVAGNESTLITMDFFYHGSTPPPNVFTEFTTIPHLSDTTKTQRYPQLLDDPAATSAVGIRTTNTVNSFPNMPLDNMTEFLEWHWEQAIKAPFMVSGQKAEIELFSMALQPISVGLQNASQGLGALSLDPMNGDKMWIEYNLGWKNSLCDEDCPKQLQQFASKALAYQKQTYEGVEPTNYVSGDLSFVPYNPLFMNDAQYSQDVFSSYGTDAFSRLQAIHQELDPGNFMTSRQQGFFFQKES